MVDHHVHHDPYVPAVRFPDQPVAVSKRAENRVYAPVVGYVIAKIVHRGGIDGREPYRVHAEPGQVIELFDYAGKVAHTVAVRIIEAARVYLIDDAVFPPGETVFVVHALPPTVLTHYNRNSLLLQNLFLRIPLIPGPAGTFLSLKCINCCYSIH